MHLFEDSVKANLPGTSSKIESANNNIKNNIHNKIHCSLFTKIVCLNLNCKIMQITRLAIISVHFSYCSFLPLCISCSSPFGVRFFYFNSIRKFNVKIFINIVYIVRAVHKQML